MRPHFLLVAACAALAPMSRAQNSARSLDVDDVKDFKVLGFVAGQTDLHVIESRLGRAKHVPARSGLAGSIPVICYVASAGDRTRVTFTPEEESSELAEFQVSVGDFHLDWQDTCLASNLIASGIATDNGLKLGLSKTAVLELLGAPTRTDSESIVYESDRPLTEREVKAKCRGNAYCSGLQWILHGEIDLTFRNNILVSFVVYRGKTT